MLRQKNCCSTTGSPCSTVISEYLTRQAQRFLQVLLVGCGTVAPRFFAAELFEVLDKCPAYFLVFLRSGHFLVSGFGKFGCTSGSFFVHLRGSTKRKQSNKSINLTGNNCVLKRWAAPRPAGYFTVGFGNSVFFPFMLLKEARDIDDSLSV